MYFELDFDAVSCLSTCVLQCNLDFTLSEQDGLWSEESEGSVPSKTSFFHFSSPTQSLRNRTAVCFEHPGRYSSSERVQRVQIQTFCEIRSRFQLRKTFFSEKKLSLASSLSLLPFRSFRPSCTRLASQYIAALCGNLETSAIQSSQSSKLDLIGSNFTLYNLSNSAVPSQETLAALVLLLRPVAVHQAIALRV